MGPVLLCLLFHMPEPSFEVEQHYIVLHLINVFCSFCSQETELDLRLGTPPLPFYL